MTTHPTFHRDRRGNRSCLGYRPARPAGFLRSCAARVWASGPETYRPIQLQPSKSPIPATDLINYKSDRQTASRDLPELLPAVVFSPHRLSQRRVAILVSFQEPFSALAARSLRSLDLMPFTQLALVFSIPLLILRANSRRDFAAIVFDLKNWPKLIPAFSALISWMLSRWDPGAAIRAPSHVLYRDGPCDYPASPVVADLLAGSPETPRRVR